MGGGALFNNENLMKSIEKLKTTNQNFITAGLTNLPAGGQLGEGVTCTSACVGIGQFKTTCLIPCISSQLEQGSSRLTGRDSQESVATERDLGQWENRTGQLTEVDQWEEGTGGIGKSGSKKDQSGTTTTTEEAQNKKI